MATFVTTLFVPLTAQAGESLARRLPDNPLIVHHAEVGDRVTVVAAAFGISLFAVVLFGLLLRASEPETELSVSERWALARLPSKWRRQVPPWARIGFRIAQAFAVLTAVTVTYVVIQAGHTGAQAVWSHYPNLQNARG